MIVFDIYNPENLPNEMDLRMLVEDFYHAVNFAVTKRYKEKIPYPTECFLLEFEKLLNDKSLEIILKITSMTILFEGFYCFLEEDSFFKKNLLTIRMRRWENHFGIPTVSFLIAYQNHIKQTSDYFKLLDKLKKVCSPSTPWQIFKMSKLIDYENNVLADIEMLNNVDMPAHEEITGHFIKTHNPSGGFATTPSDPYSLKFIEYAAVIAKEKGRVLEIGAAFGAASLQALAAGATVFCNDIEPKNLAVIRNRYLRAKKTARKSLTGDDNNLILLPGAFPEELAKLPRGYFDAILICRVLHFFPGQKIEASLKLMANLLKPGAKLFIVCETPFLKNWQRFIPEHEKRVLAGIKWPGEITNPAEFESSGRAATLPSFVHWITKEILDRTLKKINFDITDLSYINRFGQFPDDLLLNGQESVGAVVIKKIKSKIGT